MNFTTEELNLMRWTMLNCDGDGPAPSEQDLLGCVADRAMVDAESWLSEYDPEVEAYIDTSYHLRTMRFWNYCWYVVPDRMQALEPYYHQQFAEAVRLMGHEELITDEAMATANLCDWQHEGF